MKFQAPRGTRDFYPADMAVRNRIFSAWHRVSIRNGFEEYDGPIFESLDLYRVKSGEEIVAQLFHFTDRGQRAFAIRPEMTPTIARMVAARAQALSRPIKWYSVPRLCRAERPQRGRLREFFQWNIDIVGEPSVIADAECIFVAADFFREVGLTADDFVIRVNSRALLSAMLENARIDASRFSEIYAVLDKRDKVDAGAFEEMVGQLGLPANQNELLITLGGARGQQALEALHARVEGHDAGEAAYGDMRELFRLLEVMGVGAFCRFDMGVVRGLAYYTGVVFEAFGTGALQRAICGGGRYDELLKEVGGPSMSAVGFATSDVVIEDLLRERNKLPEYAPAVDIFVVDAEASFFEDALRLTMQLRARNCAAVFSYKRQSIGKQMRQASTRGAQRVIIVDAETRQNKRVAVKDMKSGIQQKLPVDALLASPLRPLDEGHHGA